jgi:hypothetical protein
MGVNPFVKGVFRPCALHENYLIGKLSIVCMGAMGMNRFRSPGGTNHICEGSPPQGLSEARRGRLPYSFYSVSDLPRGKSFSRYAASFANHEGGGNNQFITSA